MLTYRAVDEVPDVLVERLVAIAVEEFTAAVGQPATELSLKIARSYIHSNR